MEQGWSNLPGVPAAGAPDRAGAGGPPRFFALLELPTGTVLAGTCGRGTSRSVDGGRSWTPGADGIGSANVHAFVPGGDGEVLAASTGLFRSTDEGQTWVPVGLDGITVFAIAVEESRGAGLVAGTDGLGILRSTDGGSSWSPTADGPARNLTVYRLLSLAGGHILAGTDGAGVWASDGEAWRQAGLATSTVFALVELAGGRVLAGTRGDGIHGSDDRGVTWQPVGSGLPDPVVHVLVNDGKGGVLAGTGRGVAHSDDRGATWAAMGTELVNHRIFSLATTADGVVFAGSYEAVWRWDAEISRWEAVDTGLTVDEAYAVYIDPATGDALTGGGGRAFRTAGRGEGWEPQGEGLEGVNVYGFVRTTADQLLAATDNGVRVAVDEGAAGWEPAGLEERRVFCLAQVGSTGLLAGTLGHGMFRRDVAGGDWEAANDGLPNPQVFDVLVPSGGDVLAATGAIVEGAKTGGIYRSTDGGRSWAPTEHEPIMVYRLVESSSGVLFGGAQRCRLLRSTDGGTAWELLDPTGLNDTKLYCLAIDAADRLYLGAGAHLLRSTDGGDTWTVVGDGLDRVTVYDLGAHPRGALVAATSAGPYGSDDAGETWRPTPWP